MKGYRHSDQPLIFVSQVINGSSFRVILSVELGIMMNVEIGKTM
jgi:hypothetical protein